ncbi:hypothetical protein [Candidatus Poriferisodalis sp.]|uniref:hypothetical protein n=1 Tax=Candidatus Poriferisodalis sp. TaxID=3101277 RepID=UPI003B021B0C
MSDADGLIASVMALCALPEVDGCDACEGDRDAATNNATTVRDFEEEIVAHVGAILSPFTEEQRVPLAGLLSQLVDLAIRAGRTHGALTRSVGRIKHHHGLDEVQVPV